MTERIEGLSIGLDLDSLALDRGLTGLKDRLKTVNSEMKASLSAFDRADKSVEKYEATLTGLNKKLELQKRIVSESKAEYEKMVKEHGAGSKEADKAAAAYNNQVSALNSLERRITRTTTELQQLQAEQKQTISGWEKFNQSTKTAGDTLTGIGEKAKGVGQSFSASLTAPLIGFGLFAGKTALDFDKAAGTIQAELGVTGEEAEKLQETAEKLWEEGFGENIESVAVKVAGVTRALGELNEVDLSNVTMGLDLFERRGWADQQETLRAVNTLMNQFGLTASEAMDYLTRGFQENLDYSGEFLDTVSEYSTYYAELGLSVDDMFAKFKGADDAAFQLDKIGDSMKEFSIRAKDGSDTSKEAFKALGLNAGEMTKQFNKGGDTAKKAFGTVVKELKNTKDETKRNEIAVSLFGTQFEDLGEKAFDAMLEASNGLEDVEGATKKASDALQDNLGVKAQKLWRGFLTDMQPVGEMLVQLGEDWLPKVADTIGNVTKAFTDLSPEGQKATLLIGGLVAGVGPLVTVLGFATTGVGALIGALGLLTGPVGITVGILAGLAAGYLALDKAMDEPIIKSDIFAGEISESTQKAVGAYMELDENATAELNSLAWSSQTITDEMAKSMVAKYQEMGDQVLQAMIENHNNQLAEQQRLFTESDILTEEEEAKRLAKLKSDQLAEQETHNKNQARIKEIWTLAAEEKRGITDTEAKEIAKLQEGMRNKAIEELSASKQEQETILKNLKNNKSIIEAETAANTVKKSVETRDKVVKEADKQYVQTKSYAESARDDLGIISSQEAEKIIKEAERKRNESVVKAQDMHYDVVNEAKAQAGEHAKEVNWETGQVLSGWDSMYNGVISAVNWIRGLFDKAPIAKRGTVKETGRQKQRRQNAQWSPAYADGTPSSGHPGGPAIVGEEGIELAHIPGRGVTLLGKSGPEFLTNLPRGSSVLPNKQTERLLKSYGFPGYADGIGEYFDLFLKGAGSVWDTVKDKFNLSDSLIPSWLNNHTGSPLKHISTMATSWIKDLWDNWFGDVGSVSGGSGVQRWAGLATKALMIEGQYSKANLDRLLYQMQTESGGNPRAINLWDINAKRGTPSMGLLQTIMPTYQAYKHPQFDKGPYDPMSNILASIRYAMARYGSLARAYRGVGYETGGLINSEGLYRLAEGGFPEWVIPTDPSRRTDAMKLLALAGKDIGNKRPHQLPGAINGGGQDNNLLQAVLEQNRILMALLQSSQNIERKPVLSEGDIGRAAERYDAKQSSKHSIYTGRVAPI